MLESLLSISEAAKIAHCNPQKIHRAIRDKKLRAERVGWNWVIIQADLDDFLRNSKGE